MTALVQTRDTARSTRQRCTAEIDMRVAMPPLRIDAMDVAVAAA